MTVKEIYKTKNKFNFKGFSLTELLVVIAIVAILSFIAYPIYTGYFRKSQRSEALTTLLETQNKLEQYYSINNAYPANLNLLPSPPPTTSTAAQAAELHYYYTYTVAGNNYKIMAIETSGMSSQDTTCSGFPITTAMSIDNLGNKLPTACWNP
jgi:type IV pilus assembly protein PilE